MSVRFEVTVDDTKREYDIAFPVSFDLDEDILLWEYARMTPLDVEVYEETEQRAAILIPGVMKAALFVSIQRSDKSLSRREIEKLVKQVDYMSVIENLISQVNAIEEAAKAEEEAQIPPAHPHSSEKPSDEDATLSVDTQKESGATSGTDGGSGGENSQDDNRQAGTGPRLLASVATSGSATSAV